MFRCLPRLMMRIVGTGRWHRMPRHSRRHDAQVPLRSQTDILLCQPGLFHISGLCHQPSGQVGDLIDSRANRMAKICRRFDMGCDL